MPNALANLSRLKALAVTTRKRSPDLPDVPTLDEAGLKGLDANKAVVIAGLVNKVGAFSTRLAPRSTVRKIAGAIKY